MTRKRKLDPYGNLLFHLEIKNHWIFLPDKILTHILG